MRRIAASVLLICFVLAFASPVYAKHHVNKEARAAQKRNKKRAKAMKKQFRAQQKASQHPATHH